MVLDAKGLKQKVSGERKQIKALFNQLSKEKPVALDKHINVLHDIYEEKINCLDCAACCKTISPAIRNVDVERIASYLKKRPGEIVEEFLVLDPDGDYVFTSSPCPFLDENNYCSVYSVRPKACREYPHTHQRKQHQILHLTRKNMEICPIVYSVITDLKKDLK